MKFSLALGITAALHASTVLADTFTVEWASRAMFTTWRSDRGGEERVFNFGEGCRENPGPVGMQELCLYNDGGYGWFLFQGQGWRCLRRTSATGNDNAGKEVWSEVSCDWN